MNEADKIVQLVGGIFFAIGVLCTLIGLGILIVFGEWLGGGITLLLGIIFSAVGGGMLLSIIKTKKAQKEIKQNGKQFTGKIYGYVDDTSCIVNGDYLVNIKVHYFDDTNIEREAIIPTGFTRGSGDYPIGATIDILVLGTSYSWVKDSVRYEHIDREEELMDDKPIDPRAINMIGISCPNCGASFSAAKGYVSRCPYCNGAINC